jgi:hypothetical protein
MAEQKKSLVDFVNTLHKDKDWQKKFENRKQKKDDWEKIVKKELSDSDAEIVLSEDAAKLDAALGDQTPKRIVWAGAIVWM